MFRVSFEICDVLKKWLPPMNEADKIALKNIIVYNTDNIGSLLIKKYIELLKPYINILTYHGIEYIASGILFFYLCLIYIMHFPDWGRHIEDIILYNLLYLLVDHYIDDKVSEVKDIVISQMYILINNPYCKLELADPILELISNIYSKLISHCPNIKDIIILLFEAEVESAKIQNSSNLDREQYYNIALKKGAYTVQVLQRIVENNDRDISDISFNIGAILQLIDDSVDVIIDRDSNINTIATYDLKNYGNLDRLWVDIATRISNLDNKFLVFKIIYTVFVMYIPTKYQNNYSKELYLKTKELNIFNCESDFFSLLTDMLINELTIIEILNGKL